MFHSTLNTLQFPNNCLHIYLEILSGVKKVKWMQALAPPTTPTLGRLMGLREGPGPSEALQWTVTAEKIYKVHEASPSPICWRTCLSRSPYASAGSSETGKGGGQKETECLKSPLTGISNTEPHVGEITTAPRWGLSNGHDDLPRKPPLFWIPRRATGFSDLPLCHLHQCREGSQLVPEGGAGKNRGGRKCKWRGFKRQNVYRGPGSVWDGTQEPGSVCSAGCQHYWNSVSPLGHEDDSSNNYHGRSAWPRLRARPALPHLILTTLGGCSYSNVHFINEEVEAWNRELAHWHPISPWES